MCAITSRAQGAVLAAALAAVACGGDDGMGPEPGDGGPGPGDASMPADAAPADAAGDAGPPVICGLAALAPANGTVEGRTELAAAGELEASCSAGSALAPEAAYRIDVGPAAVDLILDGTVDQTASPTFDMVLSARTDCADPEAEAACVDQGFGEHLEVLAVTGAITVIVDGTSQYGGAAQGAFTLAARTRAVIEEPGSACDPEGALSRCASGARCVDAACVEDSPALACAQAQLVPPSTTEPFVITAKTQTFAADFFQGSCAQDTETGSSEHLYRIELAQAADLVATTDTAETGFDTVLYLQTGDCSGTELACNDDVDAEAGNFHSRLQVQNLAPGVYYLVVDGASRPGTGTYRLEVTLTPRD